MNQNKIKIQDKISKDIFKYPIMIVIFMGFISILIVFRYLEYFKDNEIKIIRESLIKKEIQLSKNQLKYLIKDLKFHYNKVEKETKKNLKIKINEAQYIIQSIIKNNKNKSKKQIINIIVDTLSPMRFFEKRGYYFIYNRSNKKIISHSVKKFIGKDMTKFKDIKGQNIVNLITASIGKNNEGYVDNIYFIKPNEKSNKQYRKILYLKYIKELDIVIGTGEYYDNVKDNMAKKLKNKINRIRYSKNSYFWVHNSNHELLVHPYRKKDIGKNDKELTDSKGVKLIQMFIQKAKANNNINKVEYHWNKPSEKIMKHKISFVYYLKKWDWIIGTGVYLENIDDVLYDEKEKYEQRINNLYLEILIIIFLVLLLTILIARKLSKTTQNQFKKYSNELNNLNKSLDNKIKNRTEELESLNNTLEEKIQIEVDKNIKRDLELIRQSKNAQMGEMIGNIAHQWRQPLSVISTCATSIIMQKDFGISDNKKEIEVLNTIYEQTQYLSKTINTFTNYIREEKEEKTVILQERIQGAIDIEIVMLNDNHIKLINNIYECDNIEITMIVGELSQVIINIINNAKDILIQNNINEKYIQIDLEKKDNNAIISIKDNAGGIDKNIIEKVFNPYFTTKHQSQGTGLGLHISKEIIQKSLNGNLSVINVDDGAMFKITLPLTKRDNKIN